MSPSVSNGKNRSHARPTTSSTWTSPTDRARESVEAWHLVTVIWIPYLVSSKSERYGAIGIALVLLFWAYLLGRIMTLSAVLNAALQYRRDAQLPGAPPAPKAFEDLLTRAGGLIGQRRARRAAAEAADATVEPDASG